MLQAQIETARARLVEGAGDLPENVRVLFNDAIKAIDAAIKAIEPARVKVERIWGNFDYTLPARQERSTALVRELNDNVTAQLEKADRLIQEIAYKVEQDVQPARPADASEMAVWHRKEEVAAYLRRIPGSGEALHIITQLVGEAIQLHDDLTAYVLAGGPLDWTFREIGVDRRSLRTALFRAIREANAQPIAGEALLRAYEAGEDDATSWRALRRDIASMVGEVAGVAAYGLRKTAAHSPGWDAANTGNPRRVENAGTPNTTIGVQSPEYENFKRRTGSTVPADLAPSIDLNAAK